LLSLEVVRTQRTLVLTLLRTSLVALPLAGCASLPSNGPTAGQIERQAASKRNTIGYSIVDITSAMIETPTAGSEPTDQLRKLASATVPYRSDTIRAGDTLSITIFEVGMALFAGGSTITTMASQTIDLPPTGAQAMTVRVDDDGKISLPYIGPIEVAGLTPHSLQDIIARRYRQSSQSPQALVSIIDSVENSVYLSGAVAKPGRFRLSAAKERLLDMLAIAGGPSIEIEDAEIRLVRGDSTVRARLADVRLDQDTNIALAPGDRLEIIKSPRSYTVFGATDKVSQIPFGTRAVSLSEAIARAGGPSDQRANPKRIFVFRFEGDRDGQAKPIIYRLNMMDPQSYFLSQKFAVNDKDLIYFSNSSANPPTKFLNLINLLFAPAVTARVLAKP
jgi:polysaccharide export outer membrane protein